MSILQVTSCGKPSNAKSTLETDRTEEGVDVSDEKDLIKVKTKLIADIDSKENHDQNHDLSYLWKSCNGNKPANLELDQQLSGDESSIGPRTSSTTTPNTTTPTTTPATPTTPTNSASDSLAFLRDSDGGIDRLM